MALYDDPHGEQPWKHSPLDANSLRPISPSTEPMGSAVEYVGLILPAKDRPDQLSGEELNKLLGREKEG